jgi:hypothetical protein
MVCARTFQPGELVRDHVLGLVWIVVDRDDDGTTYIEHKNIRSFTSPNNLQPYEPESADPGSTPVARTGEC